MMTKKQIAILLRLLFAFRLRSVLT